MQKPSSAHSRSAKVPDPSLPSTPYNSGVAGGGAPGWWKSWLARLSGLFKSARPALPTAPPDGRRKQRAERARADNLPGNSGERPASMMDLLGRVEGASIAELAQATGWQAHSVRSALSRLRQRGLPIERIGRRGHACRYRIAGRSAAGEQAPIGASADGTAWAAAIPLDDAPALELSRHREDISPARMRRKTDRSARGSAAIPTDAAKDACSHWPDLPAPVEPLTGLDGEGSAADVPAGSASTIARCSRDRTSMSSVPTGSSDAGADDEA